MESVDIAWLEDGQHPLDWNGPTNRMFRKFHDEDLNRPIIEHFERVARRHRNRIAVSDSETSLSYGELWDGLSGLAETIANETKPGDLIGIVLPTGSRFPLAMLACLAAGRPFVAMDPQCPHHTDDTLHQRLEDARPVRMIRQEDVLNSIESGARKCGSAWHPAKLDVDDPACVLLTSGSTGRPKSIVNSQRNLLQRVAHSINAAHINASDRFLTLASLSTIVGVRDTVTALLAGASVHFLDPQRAGAREILNVIRTEGITILFAFPALLRSVIAYAEERAGEALRLVRIGGDTTLWSDIDLLRSWLAPESAIQLIYAATEAPMMQWFVDDSCRKDDTRIPIGYPLPGNRLALIDENGGNTPAGEVGELIVSSPYVALGLETNGASSSRLFRTGDLVRQRPDGLLERIGRKDRQVKIRGVRVDLDGVEAALRKHPLVRDVGALARTSTDAEVTLVAYVSARDGAAAGLLADLKELMRAAPPAMRPARLYLTQNIPRLPSSKLDVRSLTALDQVTVQNERANITTAANAATATPDRIARIVAQVWQQVLHTTVRDPEDDFFEAGGDSLKAITFMMELERALNVELSLTLITEAPKFVRLCEAIREHRTTRYSPLIPLKSGEGQPPVFFIHGVGGSVMRLLPMARRMTYSGEVIGIQARGLAGQDPPHASVESMAAEYLREVKARQPHGPYYLCGYSFGGLVAFEMARRLRESGDEVGLVGLFDTMMSPLRWPLHSWLSIVRRRIVQFVAGMCAAPIRTWPAFVRTMFRRACEKLRGYRLASVLKVTASALTASARYRPGFYPGELTLFSPAGREPGLPSLQAIWSKHARALSIVETAGTHSTMLSAPNAEFAAASLTLKLPS
jgi:acyl-coenzyme A synthetase/AMP-(fatty) acid ligase/thioesterase domain-containing protein/acyl carrier protein